METIKKDMKGGELKWNGRFTLTPKFWYNGCVDVLHYKQIIIDHIYEK